MGLHRYRLSAEEDLIADVRAHPRALVWPIVFLFALAAASGAVIGMVPTKIQPWGQWVVGGIAALLAISFVLRPILRWAGTRYTFTDLRVIASTGLIIHKSHSLPINRIGEVTCKRGLVDRIFGSGTLQIMTLVGHRIDLLGVPNAVEIDEVLDELLVECAPVFDETDEYGKPVFHDKQIQYEQQYLESQEHYQIPYNEPTVYGERTIVDGRFDDRIALDERTIIDERFE